jgi:hypothetical protein
LHNRVWTHILLSALILASCSTSLLAQTSTAPSKGPLQEITAHDSQHDFDFEIGAWNAHLKRMLHPLSGSDTWVELEGTSIVRKIWDGRANLGELEVESPTTHTHVEGLSFRLYDPQSHQWNIRWANSKDGALGSPMIGQFKNGRGEFYNQDTFQGVAVYVRFIFSDITPTSFRFEQSFSADGGKTWEPNWIATFTLQKQ